MTQRGGLQFRSVDKDGNFFAERTNCALDLADEGERQVGAVAKVSNLKREAAERALYRAVKRVREMRSLGAVHPRLSEEQPSKYLQAAKRPGPKDAENVREIQRILNRQRRSGEPPAQRPAWRPKTRGDCATVPRPCPFVACVFNISIDVSDSGSVRYRHIDKDGNLDENARNCALDIADEGGTTLDEVGDHLGVTRERVRQQEAKALQRLRRNAAKLALSDEAGDSLF